MKKLLFVCAGLIGLSTVGQMTAKASPEDFGAEQRGNRPYFTQSSARDFQRPVVIEQYYGNPGGDGWVFCSRAYYHPVCRYQNTHANVVPMVAPQSGTH